MPKEQNIVEEILEEFDEKFDDNLFEWTGGVDRVSGEPYYQDMSDTVKDFIKSAIHKVQQDFIKKEIEDIKDLRDEHANTARHGDTPDSAYDRVENHLQRQLTITKN